MPQEPRPRDQEPEEDELTTTLIRLSNESTRGRELYRVMQRSATLASLPVLAVGLAATLILPSWMARVHLSLQLLLPGTLGALAEVGVGALLWMGPLALGWVAHATALLPQTHLMGEGKKVRRSVAAGAGLGAALGTSMVLAGLAPLSYATGGLAAFLVLASASALTVGSAGVLSFSQGGSRTEVPALYPFLLGAGLGGPLLCLASFVGSFLPWTAALTTSVLLAVSILFSPVFYFLAKGLGARKGSAGLPFLAGAFLAGMVPVWNAGWGMITDPILGPLTPVLLGAASLGLVLAQGGASYLGWMEGRDRSQKERLQLFG